jgi:hypothetical protein
MNKEYIACLKTMIVCSVIPRLDRGIQYFPYVLDCPAKPDNDIGKFFGQGIQISFRIEITGNLDEAEDEAEASHMNWLKTLQSDKGLLHNGGSLFRFGN